MVLTSDKRVGMTSLLHRNENPGGPSPFAVVAAQNSLWAANRYPDAGSFELRSALARYYDISAEGIVVGNGLDEIIFLIAVTVISDPRSAILTDATFLSYSKSLDAVGKDYRKLPLREHRVPVESLIESFSAGACLAFICNPHNPTGTIFSADELERLCAAAQQMDVLLVIDEAYAEYAGDKFTSATSYIGSMSRVCVLRTFSKAYGLAGLRVGYLLGDEALVAEINRIQEALPYSVNRAAQEGAICALKDQEFIERTRSRNSTGLAQMYRGLDNIGMRYIRSDANFVLVEPAGDAGAIAAELGRRNIVVANTARLGLPGHIRVSVGTAAEIDNMLRNLAEVTSDVQPRDR